MKANVDALFSEVSADCGRIELAALKGSISYMMDGVRDAADGAAARDQLAANYRFAANALEEVAAELRAKADAFDVRAKKSARAKV